MTQTRTGCVPGLLIAGRFRLARSLGAGAMGTVFAAVDQQTGLNCALKVLHPHVARARVNAERFRRELTLTQRVRHPAIVQIFDAGHDPTFGFYLVMELLKGASLRLSLRQGYLTTAQGVGAVARALEGLEVAHRSGIVHRDLKPDNIFIHMPKDEEPQVKLLDFGVARELDGGDLTATNIGLGTPRYMAPEQATDARSVTPASDVFVTF